MYLSTIIRLKRTLDGIVNVWLGFTVYTNHFLKPNNSSHKKKLYFILQASNISLTYLCLIGIEHRFGYYQLNTIMFVNHITYIGNTTGQCA